MLRKCKSLALLSALLATGMVAAVRSAHAEDLVRTAALLAMAEEPPPTRSEVLAKQRREEAARPKATPVEVDDTPVYKKWWFWALSAAVVGGTVALGVWAVEPNDTPAKACSPGVIGCFGDGRR